MRHSSSLMGQVVFAFVGLGLTLAAVIILNVFIQDMVRREYDRVTENTVDVMVGSFSDLVVSVKTMTQILAMSEPESRRQIFEKAVESAPHVEKFYQIIWVHKDSDGVWHSDTIFGPGAPGPKKTAVARDSGSGYLFKKDKILFSYVEDKRLTDIDALQVLSAVPFVARGTGADDGGMTQKPMVIVKALNPGYAEDGLIMGVSAPGKVLDEKWLWSNLLISRLTIRDTLNDTEIYHLDRSVGEEEEFSGFGQVYEFAFGNANWEIRTQYVKEERVYFLELVPIFIMIFGGMLTMFGILYMRSDQEKTGQLEHVNRALEAKNKVLEFEVSERARLNEALKKAEHENTALIDSVSDIIFETDTSGLVLFLNATWRKVTGFDPEQSIGVSLFKMLHPDEQEKQERDFQQLVKGQKQAYRTFTRLRTADGTFRAVEMAFSMIRQDERKNLRVVGTFTDVEERRRAERALSEAEKKYRTIVENAAGGIYQLTPEGMYLSANPALANILGYETPEAMLREVKNANEMIYVNTRERMSFLRSLDTLGTIYNHETQVMHRDGHPIWVNENVRAVRDDSGNILYYEGSMEEITQRKQAEIALREAKIHSDLANRAKSEFLANMSHELRTPLNAIIGFSEIIKNEVFGPLEQKAYWEYAKDIHKSGQMLLTVINEILDISKIEAGERQLNEGLVDLPAIVQTCLELLGSKIERGKLNITVALDDMPQIIGEELALKQAVMNLLSNAVKFTPSGGRITVSYERDGDNNLRLAVTDTGIGLDEKEIEKALSPFGQVDNALSRSGSGTGLGLTLVDALVKLHGGELELFSQKGIGTTVTIVIPADRVTVKKASDSKVRPAKGESWAPAPTDASGHDDPFETS